MAKTFLSLAGIFWATLWTLVSLLEVMPLVHNPAVPDWLIFALAVPSALVAVVWVLTWTLSGAIDRIPFARPRRWFLSWLAVSPLLALTELGFVQVAHGFAFSAARLPFWHVPWPGLIPYEIVKTALFLALWLAIVLGIRTFAEWQEQSRRMLEIQKSLAEAHLAQLKQQLQPHFLFNTLNTISALLRTDPDRADRMIAQLADLLRAGMTLSDRELVPLESELRVLTLYSEIMSERFGDRVSVEWQIEPKARGGMVPALMLQPLLENAFRHGVEASTGAQTITVRGDVSDAQLTVSVHNSAGELPASPREGTGLTNCRRRLKAHYGDAARLVLENSPLGGVIARLSLPWSTA